MALAIGLPLATAGMAAAQSAPSGPGEPSGPSGPEAPATTGTTISSVGGTGSGTGGTSGLARTGMEAALPLAGAAAAITVVLGSRRVAARFNT